MNLPEQPNAGQDKPMFAATPAEQSTAVTSEKPKLTIRTAFAKAKDVGASIVKSAIVVSTVSGVTKVFVAGGITVVGVAGVATFQEANNPREDNVSWGTIYGASVITSLKGVYDGIVIGLEEKGNPFGLNSPRDSIQQGPGSHAPHDSDLSDMGGQQKDALRDLMETVRRGLQDQDKWLNERQPNSEAPKLQKNSVIVPGLRPDLIP